MSDNKGNINSSIGKTLDYLRDLLGGKERNALERNLERDAFEREAMEGFQTISPEELEADLKQIKGRLTQRINRSNRIMIYRIAAGIAVILTLSISYLFVFDKQIDEFPENLQVSEQTKQEDMMSDKSLQVPAMDSSKRQSGFIEDELSEAEILSDNVAFSEENIKEIISEMDKEEAEIVSVGESVTAIEDEILTEFTLEFSEENEVAVAIQANVEKGVSAEAENEAISPVLIPESFMDKSASRAKKSTALPSVSREDSGLIANELSSPVLSNSFSEVVIEEVVIVDQGEEKKMIDFSAAVPESGMRKYRKYFEDNVNIQWLIPEYNALVLISFVVNEKGKPVHFRIIESPDTTFSKEAIRLVEEGPLWSPSMRSGNYSSEETRLKIVFKN